MISRRRAGTTFLVELFTHLGLDTGFEPATVAAKKFSIPNAGLEHRLDDPAAPYIVKYPEMDRYLGEQLASGLVVIDHAFIPIRDLGAAAESRRSVQQQTYRRMDFWQRIRFRFSRVRLVPGGLVRDEFGGTANQEVILSIQVYQSLLALSRHHTPITFIHYPRLIVDSQYLYEKIRPVLGSTSYAEFERVFVRVVDLPTVHQYTVADQ